MAEVIYNANKVPATYLTAVGSVLHEWALLEFNIEAICKTLLRIGPKEARLVFSQMSTRAKIDIYKGLVTRHITEEKLKTIAIQIATVTLTLNDVRNKVVHGRWCHPKDKPRTLFLYYVGGSAANRMLPKPYRANAKALKGLATAIRDQRKSAFAILLYLQPQQLASPDISDAAPPSGRPHHNGSQKEAVTPQQPSSA